MAKSKSSQTSQPSDSAFTKARGFVEANASFQTAGIALAGAGLLALVSTEAGRQLLRSATDAVVSMISRESGGTVTSAAKSPRKGGDQARA